jgi:hypothetical protein
LSEQLAVRNNRISRATLLGYLLLILFLVWDLYTAWQCAMLPVFRTKFLPPFHGWNGERGKNCYIDWQSLGHIGVGGENGLNPRPDQGPLALGGMRVCSCSQIVPKRNASVCT